MASQVTIKSFVLSALATLSTATAYGNSSVGLAVNTTSGRIIGHSNREFPKVSEYLGISFAEPPVGDLRFLPPQKYVNSANVVRADTQPPSCPQPREVANYSQPPDFVNYALAHGSYANNTSEDCLYLNVWSKSPASRAPLKPVMVWIYGGGFHAGGIRDSAQQGAIFAEQQDVVLVSMNYRLSLLGFPGAPNTQQNLGLLDQRIAIEWVRDNIEGFGGDPSRITLFGHSAGGASVDYYNYAYASDPILSGSIIMSGSALSFANRYANTSAAAWYSASSLLGCGDSSSGDAQVLTCMRTKSSTELIKVTEQVEASLLKTLEPDAAAYFGVIGAFGPTIDDVTVFENYTVLGNSANFIQRPVLIGSADDEGCLYAETGTIPVSAQDELTAVVFTCPIYHTTHARIAARLPTWTYRYFGAYPNTYADACPGRPWHGQEVYVMYGSTQEASGIAATKEEEDTGWYIRQTWADFAHNPEIGLRERAGWPEQSTSGRDVMVLGLNSTLNILKDASVWNEPCVKVLGKSSRNSLAGMVANCYSLRSTQYMNTLPWFMAF